MKSIYILGFLILSGCPVWAIPTAPLGQPAGNGAMWAVNHYLNKAGHDGVSMMLTGVGIGLVCWGLVYAFKVAKRGAG